MHRLDKDTILENLDLPNFWEAELPGRITSRTGANWQAHSPFREDRDPSFSFNVQNGLWKDFAGEGGDVLKFAMLRYSLSFPDALAYVERYVGGSVSLGFRPTPIHHAPTPKITVREYPPEEFRFFELVEGAPGNRKSGCMVEITSDCPAGPLLDLYGRPPVEAYTSAFLFRRDALEYRDNPGTGGGKGSLAGYDGPVKLPVVYLDFDYKGDPGKALWDVAFLLSTLEDLESYSPEKVRVFFSGSKGFHVLLLDAAIEREPGSENTNTMAEVLCRNLAKGLPTFDRSVYLKPQLLRAINSRHPKTGLFKIPLTLEEVNYLSIEDIKALARVPRKINHAIENEEHAERMAA